MGKKKILTFLTSITLVLILVIVGALNHNATANGALTRSVELKSEIISNESCLNEFDDYLIEVNDEFAYFTGYSTFVFD